MSNQQEKHDNHDEEMKILIAKLRAIRKNFKTAYPITARRFKEGDQIVPQPGTVQKIVHFVRHGEGFHNVAMKKSKFGCTCDDKPEPRGPCAYSDPALQDPELTEKGRGEAKALHDCCAKNLHPGIILVSPLQRATQTGLIAFEHCLDKAGTRWVAMDEFREQFGGPHICDKRTDVGILKKKYPSIDYSYLTETDEKFSDVREFHGDAAARGFRGLQMIMQQEENEVVVVSHCSFLLALFNVSLTINTEADQCLADNWFKTAELKSVVLAAPESEVLQSRIHIIPNSECGKRLSKHVG